MGIYQEVELLDHMVVLYLIYLGSIILLSTVTAPFYVTNRNAQHSNFSTSSPAAAFPFCSWDSRVCVCVLSRFICVQLFATQWTAAFQVSLSMGLSRQEYWSGLPWLPPGNLPHPGIKPTSLMFPALAGEFFTTSTTWEALRQPYLLI